MNWTKIRRETGLIEHVCEHGVGHPNDASILRMDFLGPIGAKGSWGIHGCCGCCGRSDFPGNETNTLIFSLEEYERRGVDHIIVSLYPDIYILLVELAESYDDNLVYEIGELFDAYTDEDRWNFLCRSEFMFWGLEAARQRYIEET